MEGLIAVNKRNLSRLTTMALLDAVHDRWFDIDQLRFDESAGEVMLGLAERKVGPFNAQLIISGVTRVEVEDDAQIGLYDIADVKIDPPAMQVVITSGFPLRIVLHVVADWEVLHKGG